MLETYEQLKAAVEAVCIALSQELAAFKEQTKSQVGMTLSPKSPNPPTEL